MMARVLSPMVAYGGVWRDVELYGGLRALRVAHLLTIEPYVHGC